MGSRLFLCLFPITLISGGWTRVAYLNMSDPEQSCPCGWRSIETPIRLCGRSSSGCQSVTFPSNGIEYSRVCGQVLGYQYASPDGFHAYRNNFPTVDGVYVDGVSITHGSQPRKHIWTMTSDLGGTNYCPCFDDNVLVPPYIGQVSIMIKFPHEQNTCALCIEHTWVSALISSMLRVCKFLLMVALE